ncbi:hypothetical protein EGW08_003936, partial [Elysia chlorotica]
HKTQTSSWLPPRENWQDGTGLPYGWESAVDGHQKPYFINHLEKYTTRDDPRLDPDYVEPPQPRQVELVRDLDKGFGFVAGSEKPVIVRCVTEGECKGGACCLSLFYGWSETWTRASASWRAARNQSS